MRTRALLHSVIIEEPDEFRTSSGAVSTQLWREFATALASIEALSGREYFAAAQTANAVSHRVTVRYVPGVTPRMRVVYGSRVFSVESAINLEERGRWLQLMCTERI